MANFYAKKARAAANAPLSPETAITLGDGDAEAAKHMAKTDGTRSKASRPVREERYRVVGQKTRHDRRAHIVDATVGASRKWQILTRTGVFDEPFGLHKPPNLFQIQPTLHAQLDTYHAYILVFDLRDVLGLLKAFVFMDRAIKR